MGEIYNGVSKLSERFTACYNYTLFLGLLFSHFIDISNRPGHGVDGDIRNVFQEQWTTAYENTGKIHLPIYCQTKPLGVIFSFDIHSYFHRSFQFGSRSSIIKRLTRIQSGNYIDGWHFFFNLEETHQFFGYLYFVNFQFNSCTLMLSQYLLCMYVCLFVSMFLSITFSSFPLFFF